MFNIPGDFFFRTKHPSAVKYVKAGLPYGGCPFGPFNLAETGSTNPIVEIWGRQEGPALAARSPWTRTWAFFPMGPPVPSCVILSHSMMATRHEYVARQTHHHVPRLIIAGSPPSLSLPALLHSTGATVSYQFCICTCVSSNSRLQIYFCD
jgi:hypothetical protein